MYSMKKIIYLTALCTLMGCGSAKHTHFIHQVERDTLYHQHIQYDSIYIYHDRYQEYRRASHPEHTTRHPEHTIRHPELVSGSPPDTVIITKVSTEYRYKLLRDTIRIIRQDSIPYEVTITEVKEVKCIPWWCKVLSWIGGICLILGIGKIT